MGSPAVISVLIVDDHPAILLGVKAILRGQKDINVVGICNDGLTALKAVRELLPDVALVDIALPDLNGLDVLSLITTEGLKTKVVLLTAAVSEDQVRIAMARGAKGVLLKDAAPDGLVDCVRQAAAGKQCFPADLVDGGSQPQTGRHNARAPDLELLSAREREIALLVADGLPNREIASHTNLTEGTIKVYLHHIYAKLHIRNRGMLIAAVLAQRSRGMQYSQ
jgi:two-component system, NarL family, nitrate/nitrite response regulator NarL